MGVYQSKTVPEIRRKSVVEYVSDLTIKPYGSQRRFITYMQRRLGIPRRVMPEVTRGIYGAEYRFDWFEVETD